MLPLRLHRSTRWCEGQHGLAATYHCADRDVTHRFLRGAKLLKMAKAKHIIDELDAHGPSGWDRSATDK